MSPCGLFGCQRCCVSEGPAEEEGFEPPAPFPVRRFSRPLPSTTRPLLPSRKEGPSIRGFGGVSRALFVEQFEGVHPAPGGHAVAHPEDAQRLELARALDRP